jgi:hypothetical protein
VIYFLERSGEIGGVPIESANLEARSNNSDQRGGDKYATKVSGGPLVVAEKLEGTNGEVRRSA